MSDLARSACGDPGDRRPTLVLVPGLDGTAQLFYRQIPNLAPRFRVLAFPLLDDPVHSMDDLVSELLGFVQREGASPAILCGESFGGALSLSFALAHPEHVRGLVIVNSFPVIRTRIRLRLAPLALRLLPWGAMSLVRRFTRARLHSRHTRSEDLAEFDARSRAIGRLGYVRRLELLARYDIRERLAEIDAPTLFLAADQDRLLPSVAEARLMASRVPRAELVTLEGYGHICLINHDLNLLDYVGPWCERALPREV